MNVHPFSVWSKFGPRRYWLKHINWNILVSAKIIMFQPKYHHVLVDLTNSFGTCFGPSGRNCLNLSNYIISCFVSAEYRYWPKWKKNLFWLNTTLDHLPCSRCSSALSQTPKPPQCVISRLPPRDADCGSGIFVQCQLHSELLFFAFEIQICRHEKTARWHF